MIGAYQGSSGAEAALKSVVDAMVFPGNLDVSLQWPVFLGQPSGLRVSYQRRDSEYEIGQTFRLLEVNELIFDIFIFTANEHEALNFTDGLEGGFNTFPLPAGLQAVRDQLKTLSINFDPVLEPDDPDYPKTKAAAAELVSNPRGRLGVLAEPQSDKRDGSPYSVKRQEQMLGLLNRSLARIMKIARDDAKGGGQRDWMYVIDGDPSSVDEHGQRDDYGLTGIQESIHIVPPYAFRPLGCRDLTAPEIWQLGISGRVYSVAMEYTATEWT